MDSLYGADFSHMLIALPDRMDRVQLFRFDSA